MSYQGWLAAWSYRLEDDDPITHADKEAELYLSRRSALASGRMPPDSFGGLSCFMFEDVLAGVSDAEWKRLDRIIRAGDVKAGVSRTSDWRRRKREGKVGPVGRPRKR